ncbi:MAG: hypothetical protein ACI9KN_000046 [Gammaproteobacteria bacterium]|jgi:hypothetical protein
MENKVAGSCLCGKVQYAATGPFSTFHICHCSQCRRSTGSAHASNIFTTPDRLEWLSGEDQIKQYIPDEPDIISKSFCRHCGSLVPYISVQSGKLIIPAGSLNDDPGIRPEDNIFWADRADWYDSVSLSPKFDAFPRSPDKTK